MGRWGEGKDREGRQGGKQGGKNGERKREREPCRQPPNSELSSDEARAPDIH